LAINALTFTGIVQGVERFIAMSPAQLIVAGWTGRDKAAVEKHIVELEALGVARPTSVPVYYQIAAARLTQNQQIECSGEQSSGEVEFALIKHDNKLWVGLASDHTDRHVETYNVTVSKQMCEKPIAKTLWAYEEIAPHWDQIIMRSFIQEKGARVLYQEGSVMNMLDPLELIAGFAPLESLPNGFVMLCGTFAAKGGIRPSADFEFEMEDPVLKRTMRHNYHIKTLKVEG
jgi:Protein of unknown function (DUF2848)